MARTTSAPRGISSAPKISVPSTLPRPSSRTSLEPTALPAWGDASIDCTGASILYGGDDLAVAGAAAEHTADRVHDLAFAGCGIVFQKSRCRDQHAGCACAALRGPVAQERFLQVVIDRGAGRESLDRRDLMSFDLSGGDQTGADRFTVQQDGAGAAVAGVTADLGSHQSQVLAKHFGQTLHRRDCRVHAFSIDRKCNGRLRTEAGRCRRDHSAAPHAGVEGAPHQSQGGLVAVDRGGANIIDGRELCEMLCRSQQRPARRGPVRRRVHVRER